MTLFVPLFLGDLVLLIIYQMKAEYHSYSSVLVILLFKKEGKKYTGKYIENLNYYLHIFKWGYLSQYFMKDIQIFCGRS